MTKMMKLMLAAVLSFSFIFTAVGYAALNDNLSIKGDASIFIPEGLFIVEMSEVSATNVDTNRYSFQQYSTTVSSTINRTSSRWNNRAGTVTYSITVYNNTNLEYAYRDIYYQKNADGYNGNSYVSSSNGNNSIGVVCSLKNAAPANKIVKPKEYLTFEVTYTVGRNMTDYDYNTLINFQFGINVETEEQAREAVYNKFADILNTYSTYDELFKALDNKYDGYNEWTSNYIGNVGDATADDSMVVNTLFAGQLQMIINGETRPARVLIKHENLDNNRLTGDDYVAYNQNNQGNPFYGYGCEMTMYFTVDPLTNANGSAPVYVAVFTCDRDEAGNKVSDWYRIGDTYHGYAPIVGYSGEAGGTGSFVTDNWTASAGSYSPTEEYTYRVNQGETIKTLVQVVDQNAINELQRLLTAAKAMIDDINYAGIGIDIVEKAYNAASPFFTLDASGNPIAKSGTTRAQLCHIISDLDHALDEAEKAIDEILGRG